MRVRDLSIENFRKFRTPIRLEEFGPGVNLVSEPNETGKSTVLEAMRAVLFERHGSKSDRIQSFRPHGDDVAPEVAMTFDVGDETWRIRKRFLQRPEAVLEGPGGRASGDEAEERLQELLGFTRAGNRGADADTRGALGLLWVEQGQSFVLGAPGQGARRTIEDVLAGEVGAVTGGRRANTVVQAVGKALAELLTATGKPTGRLRAAQSVVETAEAELVAASEELRHFEAGMERLEAKRSDLARLQRDLADPALKQQMAALDADIGRARMAGQAVETAEALLKQSTGARAQIEARASRRATLLTGLAEADETLRKARAEAMEQSSLLAASRKAEQDAMERLTRARTALRTAEEARRTAAATRAAAIRQALLATAFGRLDAAEAIAAERDTMQAEVAAIAMTEEKAARLVALENAVTGARAAVAAGAALLRIVLEDAAPDVWLNDVPADRNMQVLVSERQELRVPGLGTITIEPAASGETALRQLRVAEQDLSLFLDDVGQRGAAAAHAAARARADAVRRAEALTSRLEASCPADPALGIAAGLTALRGALAGEARPSAAQEGAPPQPEADPEQAYEAARVAEGQAVARREAALAAQNAATIEEMRLRGLVERASGERQRLAGEIEAERSLLSDDALAGELQVAKVVEARAVVARDEARRAAAGLDEAQLTRRREGLQQRHDQMLADRLELFTEIARLEERVKTMGGAGPAARAALAGEAAEAARVAHARLLDEAETLRLLDSTIREAQREASRRYLAPITERVAPYVKRLFPNAEIAFGPDYAPQLLIRGDRSEAAELLSKGTQEQLAVLTRIAFGDLLLEKGKPVSLVLDDALVFADDDRFETMLEILADAGQRMQVIVLSCRTSAYRALPGKRIAID